MTSNDMAAERFPGLTKMVMDGVKKDENGLVVVDEKSPDKELTPAELTQKIGTFLSRLDDLNRKIGKAKQNAGFAKDAAKNANGVKATFAWNEDKEKAQNVIHAMQNTDEWISAAVVSLADAQEMQFKFQKEIAGILKGLFIMGCCSLAKNRMVVKELQARLSGASDSDIDKMAQHELQGVIDQLNQQRDLLERQEQIGKNVKENAEKIAANRAQIEANASGVKENKKTIEDLSAADKKQNEEIERNFKDDKRRDEVVAALEKRVAKLETRSFASKFFVLLSALGFLLAVVALVMAMMR